MPWDSNCSTILNHLANPLNKINKHPRCKFLAWLRSPPQETQTFVLPLLGVQLVPKCSPMLCCHKALCQPSPCDLVFGPLGPLSSACGLLVDSPSGLEVREYFLQHLPQGRVQLTDRHKPSVKEDSTPLSNFQLSFCQQPLAFKG